MDQVREKWIGMSVVSGDTARVLGKVIDVVVDKSTTRVLGLSIQTTDGEERPLLIRDLFISEGVLVVIERAPGIND